VGCCACGLIFVLEETLDEMHGWLERARDGDPVALERITEVLWPRVARMAAHYARWCGEDADDLLQEAWIGLLEALPVLDLRIGVPEQYLIQRARWRVLDAVKRARVRRCAPLEDVATDGTCCAEAAVAVACVSEFAAGLTATQRSVLACLLAGLTWREAGHVLGCTSANIAYHVRRIRRQYEAWIAEPRL
jgi:RNA polymerase sigma-70 factor (ECF subfamily)